MIVPIVAAMGILVVAFVAFAAVVIRSGVCWGSTPEERAAPMPGDGYFTDRRPAYVAMTRGISIMAPPAVVWMWLAQLGRGAGWYSYDAIDNAGLRSARHIVSWIPPPELGDASPIGYLRHIDPGHELTWWVPGTRFVGATSRLATDIRLTPRGSGSRLVIRMSADAAGAMAQPALWVFRFIDSIMAIRQLTGIAKRAEVHGARRSNPKQPETGRRDQYQLYETIYASGEHAGRPGKEAARQWRHAAIEAGLVPGKPE
jgi:hypothetical protein